MLYITFLVVSVVFEDVSKNQGLYIHYLYCPCTNEQLLYFSATSQPIIDPAVVGFDTKSQLANFQGRLDARAISIAAATGRFCARATCRTRPGGVAIHCNSKCFK